MSKGRPVLEHDLPLPGSGGVVAVSVAGVPSGVNNADAVDGCTHHRPRPRASCWHWTRVHSSTCSHRVGGRYGAGLGPGDTLVVQGKAPHDDAAGRCAAGGLLATRAVGSSACDCDCRPGRYCLTTSATGVHELCPLGSPARDCRGRAGSISPDDAAAERDGYDLRAFRPPARHRSGRRPLTLGERAMPGDGDAVRPLATPTHHRLPVLPGTPATC